jgi:flagellar hook protein FlgE
MDLTAIALAGLQQADAQLTQAASRIASAGADSPESANPDAVSLSAELVALLAARNDFSLNLSVLKTADSIAKQAVDVMA